MRDSYAGCAGTAALLGAAAACLLTASPEPTYAQGSGSRAREIERRMDTLNRQVEQYERDKAGGERKAPAKAPGDRPRDRELAEQVRDDFEGLQAGYNKIVLAMASRERLSYDSISEAVAEVNKCAARLRENLALPRTRDGDGQKRNGAADASPLEESLLALRKHIYSFVTNRLFEAPAALDVEQAEKAGRDLDMILALSESIGRGGGGTKGRQD